MDNKTNWESMTIDQRTEVMRRQEVAYIRDIERIIDESSAPVQKDEARAEWLSIARALNHIPRCYMYRESVSEKVKAARAIVNLYEFVISYGNCGRVTTKDTETLSRVLSFEKQVSFYIGLSTFVGIPTIPCKIAEHVEPKVIEAVEKEFTKYTKV